MRSPSPFKFSSLYIEEYGSKRDVGYKVTVPDIKNNIFIDDIEECVWFKDKDSIRVYPYEAFNYLTVED